MLVHFFVENTFAASFVLFAIAFVLWNVGLQAMVKTGFASFLGIESAVGIEVGSSDGQALLLEPAKSGLQVWLEIVSIVVITRHEAGGSDDEAICICNRQDIGCFGLFAPLIGDRFAAFLGNNMRTVQVELGQVQQMLNGSNTPLPDPLQTAIPTPLAEVVIHRLPTDFFF